MKSESVCTSDHDAAGAFCRIREDRVMAVKPTNGELQKRVEDLEKQLAKCAKVEEMLKKNLERYRLLFERAPLTYQSIDEKGRLLEVNQAWLDMLGYSRSEVIGRSMAEFLSPKWQEHFEQNFPRFKALGEVLGMEFELRTKKDIPVLVSVHGRIGYDKEGNFQQTHCILYDITERDRADSIRDQIMADLQEELAREKELVNVLAACDTCSKKLKA